MVVRTFFSLSERKRALLSRDIFFLFFFSPPEKRVSRERRRKKRRRKRRKEEQFFLERKRHEKKHKKKKKPLINFAPTPGTCTRKQMKEGTERENGVNAGDACVRFWFSSARDWFFLRWKTRSFFFLFGGKGCFTIKEKRRRRRNFFSCLNRLFLAEWVTRTERKKNELDQMKNNFFFLSIESRSISNWIVGFSTEK